MRRSPMRRSPVRSRSPSPMRRPKRKSATKNNLAQAWMGRLSLSLSQFGYGWNELKEEIITDEPTDIVIRKVQSKKKKCDICGLSRIIQYKVIINGTSYLIGRHCMSKLKPLLEIKLLIDKYNKSGKRYKDFDDYNAMINVLLTEFEYMNENVHKIYN